MENITLTSEILQNLHNDAVILQHKAKKYLIVDRDSRKLRESIQELCVIVGILIEHVSNMEDVVNEK